MAARRRAKGRGRTRAKATRPARRRPAPRSSADGAPPRLAFNHALIYVHDVGRALAFYRDLLGFRVVDEYPDAYARLLSPGSTTTIALHRLEPGQTFDARHEGMRLYFEVGDLGAFCRRLAARGVVFAQPPRRMPWGWSHAYLKDPDGHELSLYRAGAARLTRTRARGARS